MSCETSSVFLLLPLNILATDCRRRGNYTNFNPRTLNVGAITQGLSKGRFAGAREHHRGDR